MITKKYRKKPVEVQAWVFPDNHNEQWEFRTQLNEAGVSTNFYDYAVEESDTPFEDGAYWRWTAVHLEHQGEVFVAKIGEVIVLDPVEGVRVFHSDFFSATYEEVRAAREALEEEHG